MTNAQAEAFLRGFHDELGKSAGVLSSLGGVLRAGKQVVAPGKGMASKLTLGQRAGRAGSAAKGFAKKHTGAAVGIAGGAGLGAGYMASR